MMCSIDLQNEFQISNIDFSRFRPGSVVTWYALANHVIEFRFKMHVAYIANMLMSMVQKVIVLFERSKCFGLLI